MRIGIYNLEPRLKNYAIEKIKLYHRQRGDIVLPCSPMESRGFDIIYASSIFSWTNKKYVSPEMITGGTGFDLTTVLPPEIEVVEPHLNFGFTTRGCIRKCKFCVVPEKEGGIHVVGNLFDLWDGKSRNLILYDNNILALPEHFELICKQAIDNNITIDFNQGLDHRLLTPEIVYIMKSVRHHEYRFAFDHPNYINTVERAIELLRQNNINRCLWYVLVGFDTTFEEDLFRVNYLRENNQNAFVQRYKNNGKERRELIALSHWANRHDWFHGATWEQFLKHPDNKSYQYLLREL